MSDQLEYLRGTVLNYMKAVMNYEKAIKRLRKGVWSGRKAKERVRELESMIVKKGCGLDLDQCARHCPLDAFPFHAEARLILARRSVRHATEGESC